MKDSKTFNFGASNSELYILGMMSGTSGDGIDGALVRFDQNGKFSLEWYESNNFDQAVRARLQRLMNGGSIRDAVLASCWVAELYAKAVSKFLSVHPKSRIDAIAAHGQTLVHVPQYEDWGGIGVRGSFQALNAPLLSQRTGFDVISDFRARDMTVGGQGAPLVPLGDLTFFGKYAAPNGVAVLNVGGIANLTVIRPSKHGPYVESAFDSGPGNMLLDALLCDISGGEIHYDDNGALAASGTTNQALLEELLEEPYFKLKPPKSTGRELFGVQLYERIKKRTSDTMTHSDIASTLLDFTVITIYDAIYNFVLPHGGISTVITAGGGALNLELRRRLEKKLEGICSVSVSDEYGVPIQAREAMAFAALGNAFLRAQPGNVPIATGASAAVLLGSFTPANPTFPNQEPELPLIELP